MRRNRSLIATAAVTSALLVVGLLALAMTNGMRQNMSHQIEMVDRDGNVLSLTDRAGDVMFIQFWGTFCASCHESMPQVASLYDSFKDKVSFHMVAVDGAQQGCDNMEEKGLELPVYEVKEDALLPAPFDDITVIPTTYIIGKDGRVMMRHEGSFDWNDAVIQSLLRDELI